MADSAVKQRLYPQLARVGHAFGSERRLEILDLLAQGPRHVEALADLTGMSVASTSQHLQVLRGTRLVASQRDGTRVVYRLADDSVLRLLLALSAAASGRLPEVEQIDRELGSSETRTMTVARDDVRQLIDEGKILLVDVRPAIEYAHGHVLGAVSIPAEDLRDHIDVLPRDRRIVAYCRGTYCMSADEAVALLREHGFDAVRLDGGWPEWRAEGRATLQ